MNVIETILIVLVAIAYVIVIITALLMMIDTIMDWIRGKW